MKVINLIRLLVSSPALDSDTLRWIVGMVGVKLGIDVDRLLAFIDRLKESAPGILDAVEQIINWAPAFGAADGACPCPDCPHELEGYDDVLLALSAAQSAQPAA